VSTLKRGLIHWFRDSAPLVIDKVKSKSLKNRHKETFIAGLSPKRNGESQQKRRSVGEGLTFPPRRGKISTAHAGSSFTLTSKNRAYYRAACRASWLDKVGGDMVRPRPQPEATEKTEALDNNFEIFIVQGRPS
jgi:hypothetical protein